MFKKAVSNDPTLCNDIVYEYAEYYTPIPMDLQNVLSKYIAREEQVPLINDTWSPQGIPRYSPSVLVVVKCRMLKSLCSHLKDG